MKICTNCGAVLDDESINCIFCNFEAVQLPIVNENEIEIIETKGQSFYNNEGEIAGELLGKKNNGGTTKAKVAIVCFSILLIILAAVSVWLGSSFKISELIPLLAVLAVILLIELGLIRNVVYTNKRPKYLIAVNDSAIIFVEQDTKIKFEDIEIISSKLHMSRVQLYRSLGYILIRTKSGAEYEEGPIEYVEETASKLNRLLTKYRRKRKSL